MSVKVRPPRLHLQGKRFGRLTVLEWVGNSRWRCLCDCGNEVNVITYNLQNGNTKSCGCLQKERTSKASLKSLVGRRFGKLTVRERAKNDRFNHVMYLCDCDCGGTVVTDAGRLRNGSVQSCGCIKSIGEAAINQWLNEHGFNYRAQYSHDSIFLSSGRRPFFDFALLDANDTLICLIEFQGRQHYGYSGYGWDTKENYLQTMRRDIEKRTACANIGVPLYEINSSDIPYLDIFMDSVFQSFPNVVWHKTVSQERENEL